MKHFLQSIALIFTFGIAVFAQSSEKPQKVSAKLEREVRKFVTDATAAEMSGDAAKANRLLAETYLLTDPYGNVEDRKPSIEFAQSAVMKNVKYDFSIDELKNPALSRSTTPKIRFSTPALWRSN